MKIIKMHNLDMEKFDGFLHTQLQNIDVDASKADASMANMNFPIMVEPAAPKSFLQKIGKKLFLLCSIAIVLLVSTLVINNNTSTTKEDKNTTNTTPNNATVTPSTINNTTIETKENISNNTATNSEENNNTIANSYKNNTTVTTTKMDAKVVIDANGNKKNKDIIENKTNKNTTPNNSIDNNLDKLINTNIIVKAQLDTATTKPIAKKVEVKRDTINIIW